MARLSRVSRMPLVLILMCALTAVPARADRTQLKPGWNIFSPQQDVEMGREVAKEAEAQLQLIRNRNAETYIDALGKQLASRAPGEKYPYQFKLVNDKAINAFALPGGFVYINRGTVEAARSEAELASVVAHEIGHVALRHGTNQASKAYATQVPLQILGGVLGSNSVGSVLAQLGIGFAANSVLLKYSRDAERQADLLGVQILYDSGYDPQASVSFFERLQAEGGDRAGEFFSSHPNPENRIANVKGEIERLGRRPSRSRTDSPEFQQVRTVLTRMAAPSRAGNNSSRTDANTGRPASPSGRYVRADFGDLTLRHPDNWQVYGQGNAFTLAPDGGIVSGSLAYGMMAAVFEPNEIRNQQVSLEEATDQLIDELRRSNPKMRIARGYERTRVGGQQALSMELSNESPIGSLEVDSLVTVQKDGLLYYFVGVAPQNEFRNYQKAFSDVVKSVKFG